MAQVLDAVPDLSGRSQDVIARVQAYPRLRYMGSKYRVIPHLVHTFSQLRFESALDAFSGSGVVGYALKCLGKQVTTNDYLNYSATVAAATVANSRETLTPALVNRITGPSVDQRSFIRDTFDGLYFPRDDHEFLDSAWSHINRLSGHKKSVALAALCLAAARKQPRGVFTVTSLRYDDGRRQLRDPLKTQFVEAVAEYNAMVFDNGKECRALCGDVFEVDPTDYDLVYLDPPYAPPRDDNDYIKRYHFLEGLSVYWRDQEIMQETTTKKLVKRYTPFAYKHTITRALEDLFELFRDSTIVLSYNSNSVPDEDTIRKLLKRVKKRVSVVAVPHRYHFGTHQTARRRQAHEYIFVAR